MQHLPRTTLITVAAILFATLATAQTVFDVARPRTIPEGAPKASDVIMRSLRVHPANASDPHDTLKALRDFHVTRLEWAYINNPDFVEKVKASGCLFGGAAAAPSYTKANKEPDWFEKVVIVNLDGEPIIAPWKRNWNRTLWGCVNNPELERGYLEYLKCYIDAGARIMQRDEPRANLLATYWGGCFCDHCMAKFTAWLEEHTDPEERTALGVNNVETFSYRTLLKEQGAPVGDPFRKWDGGKLRQLFTEFQTESTIAFHKRTREAIDAHAGRRVPISCNNGTDRWGPVEIGFDWVFGELSYVEGRPSHLLATMREAAKRDRIQVVTMPKSTKWETTPDLEHRTRSTIAMAYACGGHCMVPWDTYMPGDTPRYFGTPQQYADLYGFIRANAQYLDNYEEAAVFGPGLEETRYGDSPPVTVLDNDRACAIVRAVPGHNDLPAVVHLVDWSGTPAPLTVRLSPDRFFEQPSTVRLLTPAPYETEVHEKAEETDSFDQLIRTMPLEVTGNGELAVPPLNPWAILVVSSAG